MRRVAVFALLVVWGGCDIGPCESDPNLSDPVLPRDCMRILQSAVADPDPPSPPNQIYTWPAGDGRGLFEFVRDETRDGDYIYIPPGTYQGNIYSAAGNLGGPGGNFRRLHVYGAGPGKTLLHGRLVLGAGSTISNMAIDDRLAFPNLPAVEIVYNDVRIHNTWILGGTVGVESRGDDQADLPTFAPERAELDCVQIDDSGSGVAVEGVTSTDVADVDVVLRDVGIASVQNGAVRVATTRALTIEDSLIDGADVGILATGDGTRILNTQIQSITHSPMGLTGFNAGVSEVDIGGVGSPVLITGDSARFLNSNVSDEGVFITGNDALVQNVTVVNASSTGLHIEGDAGRAYGVTVQDPGATGISMQGVTGLIVGATVTNPGSFGISVQGNGMILSGLTVDGGNSIAVSLDGVGDTLQDSLIGNLPPGGLETAVYIPTGSSEFLIIRNEFHDAQYGIWTQVSPDLGTISDNTYTNISVEDVHYAP